MQKITNKKYLTLLGALMICVNPASAASTVLPETLFSVVYPAVFDSDNCNQTSFSGPLASLSPPKAPVTAAYAIRERDPINHREALLVQLNARGFISASVRVEGDEAVLQDIETKLSRGQEVKLTEFKRCAETDKSLQLVELVDFTPSLQSLAPDLGAKIEFIKKNDQGVCAAVSSRSLGDVVKAYNPGINLNEVEGSVNVSAYAIATDSGKLISKAVTYTFHKKDVMHEQLSRPVISIQLPPSLSYTAINKLQHADSVLRMTGKSPDCKGERMDDPVWVHNIEVS